MLISSTTTKSPNVALNGTDVTVKYLSFCQDFRTPNRFLAQKLPSQASSSRHSRRHVDQFLRCVGVAPFSTSETHFCFLLQTALYLYLKSIDIREIIDSFFRFVQFPRPYKLKTKLCGTSTHGMGNR